MGRRRAAPSRPLLEASGGGGRDRAPTCFGRDACCHRRLWVEGRAGTGQRWRRPPPGSNWARAGRKGPAIGTDGCRQALDRRGPQEGASRELWPGEGREEVAGGRRSDWQRVEAPRGVGRAEGHIWGVFFSARMDGADTVVYHYRISIYTYIISTGGCLLCVICVNPFINGHVTYYLKECIQI